jgi:hypothetical protein
MRVSDGFLRHVGATSAGQSPAVLAYGKAQPLPYFRDLSFSGSPSKTLGDRAGMLSAGRFEERERQWGFWNG